MAQENRLYIDSLRLKPGCHAPVLVIGGEIASHLLAEWGRPDLDFDEVRMDASTHSLQTVTYEHHEIHSGSHYFVIGYQDLANGNVLDFTWLMPDTARWIHWVWTIDTEAEVLWSVYENAIATNPLANIVTPYNSNRNSLNTSGTTMRYELQGTLAAANADTNVTAPAILLETGISGAGKRVGGNALRDNELVLKQDTLYCLRAIANAAGYINFNMQWYEHTNRD
jgi:hypothetical protein